MTDNPFLAAALSYASLGYAVFPCVPGGKTPLTKRGLHDATTDEKKIIRWWAQWPTANVAINCGASNLAVVDLDMKDGVDGVAQWEAWCVVHDTPPNGTWRNFTPSGGQHLIYYGHCKNSSSKLGPGIDTRGDGGYIVVPPSVVNGVPYRTDPDARHEPADLPTTVAVALQARAKPEREPPPPATSTTASPSPAVVSAGSLAELIQGDGVALSRKGALEEWCGPCPWCGGHDRFVVGWIGEGRDAAGRYFCRKCERSGDAVSWMIDRKGAHPVAAKDARGVAVAPEYRKVEARLGGGAAPSVLFAPVTHPTAAPPQPTASAQLPSPSAELTEEATNVLWLRTFERIDFPMILDNLLPAGIVGGINAEGGTGKTYMLIAMFAAISSGIAWGPFRPTRPHKCLLLLGEDPTEVVRNRIHDIARQIIPASHLDLFAANFHAASVRGLCGPIMSLSQGNAAPSSWADWLDATLGAHGNVELLGLDPLRKFYGLDENKNEHAHAFIGLLEAVTLKRSLTILYNHHIAKLSRELAVGQITGRGAGGLSDNCRWMAAMRTVDEKTAAYLELEGPPSDFVEFAVTKSNYAPILPRPAYFQRGEYGVLLPAQIDQNRIASQVEYLADLIDGLRLSVRDLVKEARAADVRAAMKERFTGFKKEDFHRIVEHGVEVGILVKVPMPFGRGGRMTEAIMRAGQ